MYRVFLSHSRRDNSAAQAVFQWLTEAEPSLKGEIFLDVNPRIGFAPGVRWKSELARAVDRCEAVICLISPDWEKSGECVAEARLAESLNKRVFCPRRAHSRVADLRSIRRRPRRADHGHLR
jgi:hypothetical protein